MVSGISIVCMAMTLAFIILLAVFLPVCIKKKFHTAVLPYFIGCGVFLVFALILEQLMHMVVLGISGTAITDNMWLYALYGGLAAGIFEETGRFLAMKFLMKKHYDNPHNGLMYGAGHGCFEAFMIVGTMMINNIVYSVTINAGLADKLLDAVPAEQKEQMQAVISQLIDAPSYMFLLSGAERITAVMLHIALSVLVWTAVVKNKTVFYPLAIFFHALLDGVLVVLQQSGVNSILLEVILFVLSLAIAVFAYGTWKREFKNTTPAVT